MTHEEKKCRNCALLGDCDDCTDYSNWTAQPAPAGRLPPLCQMVNAIAQTRKADLPEKHCEGHCQEVAVLIDGEWVTGCCHAPARGRDGQTFSYCPKCGKGIEVVK